MMILKMKITTRIMTFSMRICNFISAIKDLNMMMEMTSKIITKEKMIMRKIKIIVEMYLKMRELKELCLQRLLELIQVKVRVRCHKEAGIPRRHWWRFRERTKKPRHESGEHRHGTASIICLNWRSA